MLAVQFALFAGTFVYVYSSPLANSDDDLGTIVFSNILFRHGDRSPTQSYPNDPYNDVKKYWPRGYGQLSELGEEQHYRLGQFLRRRYAHFLPQTYNVNDTYVRSTDVDRALASALCNLAGLYPPTENITGITFQSIPVHSEAGLNDKLLQPSVSCRKYSRLLSLVKKSTEYQCVNDSLVKLQSEVAHFTGSSTFHDIIYDILHIESLYNLTLPAWTKPYYPSPLKEIDLFEFFITSASTTELQRLAAGPLVKEMVSHMERKSRSSLDPDRSLYIYSAHDTNVVDTLQALRVFNGILVPYAATVLVELRERAGHHYVTVSYKNSTNAEPYLLQLPGCETVCPLDQFIELTKDVVPEDVVKECQEESDNGTQTHLQVPASAILPEWQHCFENSTVTNGIVNLIVKK